MEEYYTLHWKYKDKNLTFNIKYTFLLVKI